MEQSSSAGSIWVHLVHFKGKKKTDERWSSFISQAFSASSHPIPGISVLHFNSALRGGSLREDGLF